MGNIEEYIQYIATIVEALGVVTIILGIIIALVKFLLLIKKNEAHSYSILRQELGKGILLGLEILVAGDIIATVVTEPTMDRVLALAVIVLIRTFLSFSIELEITGKFPWQKRKSDKRLEQDL